MKNDQDQKIQQMQAEVIRLENLIFAQIEPKNKLIFTQDNKRFWDSFANIGITPVAV